MSSKSYYYNKHPYRKRSSYGRKKLYGSAYQPGQITRYQRYGRTMRLDPSYISIPRELPTRQSQMRQVEELRKAGLIPDNPPMPVPILINREVNGIYTLPSNQYLAQGSTFTAVCPSATVQNINVEGSMTLSENLNLAAGSTLNAVCPSATAVIINVTNPISEDVDNEAQIDPSDDQPYEDYPYWFIYRQGGVTFDKIYDGEMNEVKVKFDSVVYTQRIAMVLEFGCRRKDVQVGDIHWTRYSYTTVSNHPTSVGYTIEPSIDSEPNKISVKAYIRSWNGSDYYTNEFYVGFKYSAAESSSMLSIWPEELVGVRQKINDPYVPYYRTASIMYKTHYYTIVV